MNHFLVEELDVYLRKWNKYPQAINFSIKQRKIGYQRKAVEKGFREEMGSSARQKGLVVDR